MAFNFMIFTGYVINICALCALAYGAAELITWVWDKLDKTKN